MIEYKNIYKFLKTGIYPSDIITDTQKARFRKRLWDFSLEGDKLFRTIDNIKYEYLPDSEKMKFLDKFYNNPLTGFIGHNKLFEKVKNYGITEKDVSLFLSGNKTNNSFRIPQINAVVQPIISSKPKERYEIDLIDLEKFAFFNDNNKYCLCVIDHFSKYSWVFPIKTKGEKNICDCLESIFKVYPCNILHSDNGTEFKNKSLSNLCSKYQIKQIFGTPYHPQSQGCIERFNQTLKNLIKRYLFAAQTKNYTGALPSLIQNYNNSIHSTIKDTPFNVFFGKSDNNKIKSNIISASNKFKTDITLNYKIGDFVRIYKPNDNKFKSQWSNEIYEIQNVGDKMYTVFNKDLNIKTRKFFNQVIKVNTPIDSKAQKIKPVHFDREEHIQNVTQGVIQNIKIPKRVSERVPEFNKHLIPSSEKRIPKKKSFSD